MDPRRRDGLSAVAGLAVLLAAAAATAGLRLVLRPDAAVVGVGVALVVEAAFLRYPERLLGLWERRGTRTAGLLAVLALGAAAVRYAPTLLGALAWGLATYLALLGCVLAGLGNPLSSLVSPAHDRE